MSEYIFSLSTGALFPDAQKLVGAMGDVVHPLLILAVLATVFFVFRPLLAGFVRAAVVFVVPRRSLEQRVRDYHGDGVRMLNRMAEDYSHTQPNFAAELRSLASRDN